MSGATLWERLDDALIAAYTAAMGTPGDFDPEGEEAADPLWVQVFAVGDTWNPDAGPFPALLLISNNADIDPGQHGAPIGATETTYRYMAVAVAEATSHGAARTAAQTLLYRMRKALQGWPATLAASYQAGSGETADTLSVGAMRIEVRGRQGPNRGRFLGIAVQQFSVEATEGALT